jgi:DNA-binding beta-propeller fold protein YncE
MKASTSARLGLVFASVVALPFAAKAEDPLRLVQTIKLPSVDGRIDHFAVDIKSKRLFVAALGNNTVEVVDLANGSVAQEMHGLKEPQGVAFLADEGLVAVASAGDGSCRFFASDTLKPVGSLDYQADADNLRYDSSSQRLFVGYGDGSLGAIDAKTRSKLFDVKLPGHPESFQIESHGARIFINVPSARQISVVDRKVGKLVATWSIEKARTNFPMALDEDHHRLFVGCRQPAEVLVFDTESGKRVTSFSTVGDTDDLFYEGEKKRLYVSGGEGFLATYQQDARDGFAELAKTPTVPGARTSLFVPSLARLYLAVPRRGTQSAEIRVYESRW